MTPRAPGAEGGGAVPKVMRVFAWLAFATGFFDEVRAGWPADTVQYARMTADSAQLFAVAACAWIWAGWYATPPTGSAARAGTTEGE